jgi:hypothetical protein
LAKGSGRILHDETELQPASESAGNCETASTEVGTTKLAQSGSYATFQGEVASVHRERRSALTLISSRFRLDARSRENDTSRSVPPYCTRRFTGTFLFSTTKIDIRTSSRESCIASNQALSATDSLHSVKVVQRYGRYESICMLRVAAAHGGLHSITQYI